MNVRDGDPGGDYVARVAAAVTPLFELPAAPERSCLPHDKGSARVRLAVADLIAFAAASDLAESRRFYEDTLGLPLVSDEAPIACVFDANGTMLRVTAVPEVASAGYTALGWIVADIETTIGDLVGRGVGFLRFDGMDQDDIGIWTAPSGDRIAWFADPASNVLSLTQPRT